MYDCLGNRRLCRSVKVGKGATTTPTARRGAMHWAQICARSFCTRQATCEVVWSESLQNRERIRAERTLHETFHGALINEAIGNLSHWLRNASHITAIGSCVRANTFFVSMDCKQFAAGNCLPCLFPLLIVSLSGTPTLSTMRQTSAML
jgi:hypothetical protein